MLFTLHNLAVLKLLVKLLPYEYVLNIFHIYDLQLWRVSQMTPTYPSGIIKTDGNYQNRQK